jgi:hypothetical protein
VLLNRRILLAGLVALCSQAALAQFTVDVSLARTDDEVFARSEHVARQLASNLARATVKVRVDLAKTGHFHPEHPVTIPATIWLTDGGAVKPCVQPPGIQGGGLTLVFDANGPRSFPQAYQDQLQAIFNSAQATMNAVFGQPAVSGNVFVKNYNADISDRGFFSGGFFVPNGGSGPEIHFPVYTDDASIAANFIHVLLLAYLGPNQYGFDAFNEGLVRAATMKVARTPAALPGYNQAAIADVLENSYDVGAWYDWYNQRALGGPRFVAPNLVNQPLSGGVGGLYLLRYRMAGSAWQKVLAEHPTFIANFNTAFYANPGIANNAPALVALAQTTLNTIAPGNPTVEGSPFAQWFIRQFILETHNTSGNKVLVQPVPFTAFLNTGDYGPFLIQANYFKTLASGNEVLSTATSFPIYWQGDLDLSRLFTNVQDERIEITSGYGAVVPNLPDLNGGVPYRGTVDVPVQDQLGRVYLPVGSIATAADPVVRDFYGTVTGVALQAGESLVLQLSIGGVAQPDIPVTNEGAFGALIGTANYLDYNTITVAVVRQSIAGDVTLLTRKVNKGPGPLALDLRVASDVDYVYPRPLPKGISTIGFPVDPWLSYNPDIVGASTLIARYDPSTGRYDLFPDTEAFKIGLGYFLRSDATQLPFTVSGRIYRNIGGTVSLRPGWNLISNALTETSQVGNVRSVRGADFARFFTDAQGSDIGTEFFEFQPGQNDPVTGAPETGSMIPATVFEEGKAYFVRVLAPEGVTLVFNPAGGQLHPESLQVPINVPGWKLGVTLIDGVFKVGAQIGQSSTATSFFDPREDAEMPPSISGGRQVVVVDSGTLYRDVRKLGVQQTYSVNFTGLKAGRTYAVKFDKLRNSPGLFALYRPNGSIIGHFQPGQQVMFTASSPTTTLKIKVSGGYGQ